MAMAMAMAVAVAVAVAMAVAVAVVGCGILFLVLGTQHGLRRYVEECKLLCFTRINSRSALLMRRLLPLLLLLGAGPPAPVLRLQGNWQSLAPPLRLDWTCFSLGQRRRLSLTSLAQRRVGLCSTATSPASHAITLAPCTIVVTVFTEATVLVPGVTASSRAVTPVRPWPTWVAGLVPPFNSNGNRPGPRWHMHWQSLVRGAHMHCRPWC